ncbi:MAG: hypothetical protein K8H88_31315 [Sandaracinaceae bacterium]|nr:hypothetical protein [Sandaracinaceae bacterium]
MRLLRRWLGAEAPPTPLFLRVLDPGGRHAPVVHVEATWSPSGHRVARTHRTAAGLCVIPWLEHEDGVRLEVRSGDARHALHVRRDRPDRERVEEVRLVGEPNR